MSSVENSFDKNSAANSKMNQDEVGNLTPNSLAVIWKESLSSLQSELDPQIFSAYIKPLMFSSYNTANSELVISAPSKFLCEHVESNYREKITNKIVSALSSPSNPHRGKATSQVINGLKIRLVVDKLSGDGSEDEVRSAGSAASPVVVKKIKSSTSVKEQISGQPPKAFPSGINQRYTFSNFVVGSSNQFCHAAAQRIAEEPGTQYNPLFIYGGVGLGKTHLLHAIGNAILERRPSTRVLYMSSESFMNELILGLRSGKMDEFKAKLRSIELLLIDDIQFMVGKERTQEEFFHTFNALYASKHQIVITSDRVPQDLTELEERLTTRFAWGLIADLQAPDYETRCAILKRKALVENVVVPDQTIHYIAENFSSNVRELEGALTRVLAHSSLKGCEITPDLAPTVLQPMLQPKKINVTVDDIKTAVAAHFGLKVSDLSSKRRTRNLSFPRHIAMYLCRKHTTASYPEIGELFGGRDHSSVIHAANVVSRKLGADSEMKVLMEKVEQRLFS